MSFLIVLLGSIYKVGGYFYTLSKILKWPPLLINVEICQTFLLKFVRLVPFSEMKDNDVCKNSNSFFVLYFFFCILPQLFCSFRQLFYYSKSPFQNWAADPSRKCLIDYSISWWRIIISCIYCTMYPPKKIRVKIISQ